MHYGDLKHIKSAKCEIVIYAHEESAKKNQLTMIDYEICSIYKCQHIDMYAFQALWDNFEITFKKQLDKLDRETFYLITLSVNKINEFTWVKSKKVTDAMIKKNPALGLH